MRKFPLLLLPVFVLCCLMACTDQAAQTFNTQCATCHIDNGLSRAPGMPYLANMTPRSIVSSLESGKMQVQGALLSADEKVALAEFITQKTYTDKPAVFNACTTPEGKMTPIHYQGFGGNLAGTGMTSKTGSSLSPSSIPNLKLKWAFGFEGGTVTRAKPAVVGDYIIFGRQYNSPN
ncbi:MAG: c-type cytochrome [Bacteroidota bacterium]